MSKGAIFNQMIGIDNGLLNVLTLVETSVIHDDKTVLREGG